MVFSVTAGRSRTLPAKADPSSLETSALADTFIVVYETLTEELVNHTWTPAPQKLGSARRSLF